MSRAWIEAPFPFWGHLRTLSAQIGTRLEESRGFIRRTFTFYGTNEQVAAAHSEFERLRSVSGR